MAVGSNTKVADVIVPTHFTPIQQQITETKSRLIQSGVLVRDPFLDNFLAGNGLTVNVPSQRDLDDDPENISTDDASDLIDADFNAGTPNPRLDSTPFKTQQDNEIAVRMSRNNSWAASNLASALAGNNVVQAIGNRVGSYWARRLQTVFIAIMNGVIGDNTTNDSADFSNDVSGGAFIDGVTNFTAEALLDTTLTMGDSMEDLAVLFVHSVVFNRMQKQNLIDTIPDSRGETLIRSFQGYGVIIDDSMPATGNVYDSWLFGAGAVKLGVGTPENATELSRQAAAGNGGGQDILHSRVEWSIHPEGMSYVGASPDGGPGNGTGANEFANAASWNRVRPERKMIKFARLVTREA